MFKVGKKDTIQWPVLISVPQDGGGVVKVEFTATFKILSKTRVQELVVGDLDDSEQVGLAEEVLVGWDTRVVDDSDPPAPVPFSPEAKREFLEITYVRAGVVRAFTDMSSGRKAARKN